MPLNDNTRREIEAADAFGDHCWRLLSAKLGEIGALPNPEADDDLGRGERQDL